MSKPKWIPCDGGRSEAGYKGHTGDCACRAIAIAVGMPYKEAYQLINNVVKGHEKPSKRKSSPSHARTGVYVDTMHIIMEQYLGWYWTPTMKIGTGCTVHVNPEELPEGNLVLRLSKHYAAFVDGALYDTHDSSRDGTRCVYGYWSNPY